MLGKAISNFIDICPAVTKAKQSTIWEKGEKKSFIYMLAMLNKDGKRDYKCLFFVNKNLLSIN